MSFLIEINLCKNHITYSTVMNIPRLLFNIYNTSIIEIPIKLHDTLVNVLPFQEKLIAIFWLSIMTDLHKSPIVPDNYIHNNSTNMLGLQNAPLTITSVSHLQRINYKCLTYSRPLHISQAPINFH